MWAKDRHHRILALLTVRGQISNDLLMKELEVSRETIRRDIQDLESAGLLKRVHGGVVAAPAEQEPPFKARMRASEAEKRRIGMAAAALIEPGMLCAIDTGTTTLAFAAALSSIPDVSVVTNSLDVATTIRAAQANATVILLGGRIGNDVPGTFGELAIAQMEQFRPDVAILSPVAIDAEHGATSYDLAEAQLGRVMIDRAECVMILADYSKLGKTSRVGLCGCDQVDVLVTDRRADQGHLSAIRKKHVGKIVAA
ncbi:MAG: DeoR/GlpR family DNA-binding transcription regulator [Xanthobacteraceae bacterium]|nr:DeoR/GlpR family DNA-binding transcription regulator [Xanthobacteraceae bacterium]